MREFVIIGLIIILSVILSVVIITCIKAKCVKSIIFNNWLIVLLIIILGIDVCCNISNCVVQETNIVLTFIGILATFIVISNYEQVKDVEKKACEHKKEVDEQINALKYDLCVKYGYVFESLFKCDEDMKTIFLYQACNYLSTSLDYCKNESERKMPDKNIKQCIDNIRANPVKLFPHISHKIDCRRITAILLNLGYDVEDILEQIENTPVKNPTT